MRTERRAALTFVTALVAAVATSPVENWNVVGSEAGAPFTLNDAAPEAAFAFEVRIAAETFADPELPAVQRSLGAMVALNALDADATVSLVLEDELGAVLDEELVELVAGGEPASYDLLGPELLEGCDAAADCAVAARVLVTRVEGGLVWGEWGASAWVGGDQVAMPDGAALELVITEGGAP